VRPYLVLKSDIMHIVVLDKGKPTERRGRKTTGLRDLILRQRGYRYEYWVQDYNKNGMLEMANYLPLNAERYK